MEWFITAGEHLFSFHLKTIPFKEKELFKPFTSLQYFVLIFWTCLCEKAACFPFVSFKLRSLITLITKPRIQR